MEPSLRPNNVVFDIDVRPNSNLFNRTGSEQRKIYELPHRLFLILWFHISFRYRKRLWDSVSRGNRLSSSDKPRLCPNITCCGAYIFQWDIHSNYYQYSWLYCGIQSSLKPNWSTNCHNYGLIEQSNEYRLCERCQHWRLVTC